MNKILIFGGLMIDRYYYVESLPKRGGDSMIRDSFDRVGGCAVNMAFTVKNLRGTPYIVSAVGNDEMGGICLDYLQEKGMLLDCVRKPETLSNGAGEEGDNKGKAVFDSSCRTGYCLVFVEPDGERTFLTREGCEGEFAESLIPAGVAGECRAAALTGYYLLGKSGGSVVSVLEKLKANGYSILFDPGPMVSRIAPDLLAGALELSDVITANWDEALILAERDAFTKQKDRNKGKGPEAWAKDAATAGRRVVLTRGTEGGIAFE